MTASSTRQARTRTALVATLIAATLLVYANTFSVPFVFDDIAAITRNPTIRDFSSAFSPPDALSVTGRPLVNLSLALSHALSGQAPWGYHAVNLAIHVLATLTLFGAARRTFLFPRLGDRFGDAATPVAFFIALLWAVHPLQTASVTYVMQRTETLMALCYLLTLHAFIRSVSCHPLDDKSKSAHVLENHVCHLIDDKHNRGFRWGWQGVAVIACFLGMASKEVMVSAPLAVLLYDRTFIAGSFRAALRRRSVFYAALASSWILLGYFLVSTDSRGASAGFGLGMTPAAYALTQFSAVARYLHLALWPHPLVFDYGNAVVTGFTEIFPAAILVLSLLAGVLGALRRWPGIGFAGVFFFAVLAPSSSIVPVATQTMAEHRMYLPLAAVISLLVTGLYSRLGQRSFPVWALVAVGLSVLTVRRNADYRSERAIWEDTVTKRPENARARYNLGVTLLVASDLPAARVQLEAAVRLQPDHVPAQTKLGGALLELGNPAEALVHFEAALAVDPNQAEAHDGLARTLTATGRLREALPHFEQALRLSPFSGIAQLNLGNALLQSGRAAEALAQFEIAQKLLPTSADVRFALGNALVQVGRLPEAVARYEEALRRAPDSSATHYNLGNALAQLGRYEEALAQFEETTRLAPADQAARNNLHRLRSYLRK